ncbi:hypothetical protein POAN111098_04390 [Polynucleobacter antarcticus]
MIGMNYRPLIPFIALWIYGTSLAAEDENRFSLNYLNLKNDSRQYASDPVLEFWGYHDSQGDDNTVDTLKLRYYQPIEIGKLRGMARLDTAYAKNYGPSFPAENQGQYSAGNTMLTVWGSHPNILPNWGANLGARIIFPFGNNGQWAIGPQIGSSFKPTEGSKTILADFSPLVRYMYGFDTKNNSFQINPNQPHLVRNLQLFPTIGITLGPHTQIRFWDENGIIYNSAGGGWFVPLDAMVTHRLSRNLLFAVGAAKQVVQTYNVFNLSVYGKVSYSF